MTHSRLDDPLVATCGGASLRRGAGRCAVADPTPCFFRLAGSFSGCGRSLRLTRTTRVRGQEAVPETLGAIELGLDNGSVSESGVEQSGEVDEAAWIAGRLSSFDSGVATSVVPRSSEVRARPAPPQPDRGRPAARSVGGRGRWSGVQRWCRGSTSPEVAMPEHEPAAGAPWPDGAPDIGTLYPPDAVALSVELARHTTTPGRCWFCTWEGWGRVTLNGSATLFLQFLSGGKCVGALHHQCP